MNVKEIANRMVKEADISPAEYPVVDRMLDMSNRYRMLIAKAQQIGSLEPISNGEVVSETFVVVAGDQTFTRTIKDIPIQRVDFQPDGGSKYYRLTQDESRGIGTYCHLDLEFFVDEKRVFIENGRAGTLRVTYVRGLITNFTVSDYNTGTLIPTWLLEEYHPLLYLYDALRMARKYKKDTVDSIVEQIKILQPMFDNHYKRNAKQNSRFDTSDEDFAGGECCGEGGENYR